MKKWEGPIFEYACHEGNYGLAFILSAARAQEKAAGPARYSFAPSLRSRSTVLVRPLFSTHAA